MKERGKKGRQPMDTPARAEESTLEDARRVLRLLGEGDPGPAEDQPEEAPAGCAERYRKERLHAVGGMGEVWQAWDRQLQRRVAVKELLHDRRGDAELQRRFLREAHLTGRLQHPGIVPVHELFDG